MPTTQDSREPKSGSVSAPNREEGKLDSRDVSRCFQLLLGRPAKPDVDGLAIDGLAINGLAIDHLSTLLRQILDSDEFQTLVLQPVLLREELPHGTLDGAALFQLIDWAQARLPISDSTRLAAGAARTPAQLLELLLADGQLLSLSPGLLQANVDSVLRERLENEPWSKVQRSVIGVVDAASGFEIRGWAVDLCNKSVPVILEFFADNLFLGSVTCLEPRPDVLDNLGGSGKYGFTFQISAAHRAGFSRGRTLTAIDSVSRERVGAEVVVYGDAAQHWDVINAARQELAQVRQALERIEARLPELSRLASIPLEAYDEYWERFYRPTPEVLAEERARSARFTYLPVISIVLPIWKSDTRLLSKAIASVFAQTYDHWELIITDDASNSDELRLLHERYQSEPRVQWLSADERGGIAVNTNRGIASAKGDYIAFLDHDDELAPDALYQVARALQESQYALVYSDEDRIEENEFGRCVHHTPFFKPGFDPDLLLAMNYICHFVALRRDLISEIGGLRSGFEGAQDHDLLLRATAHLSATQVRHVPRILYHWRVTPGSLSRTPAAAEDIQNNIVAAVKEQIQRFNVDATVEKHKDPIGSSRQFAARVRWNLPAAAPKVSIIMATRDRVDLLRPCLDSVLESVLVYPGDSEIVLIDNDSAEPETMRYFDGLLDMPRVRLIPFHGAFNYSAINNAAVREARGEVLIFLNNDTLVLSEDWCVELVSQILRKDVGAVGARLLYADGTIQHAGVVLGVEGVAGHECVGEAPASGGYFGRSHVLRGTAAVTGACMATKRSLFTELGGFDDLNLKVAFNDIDYCMKVRNAGYRVVYTPFATLYHLESKSRGREVSELQQTRHRAEAAFFRSRWGANEVLDPYYNPHFERFARPFERLRPPPA